MYNLKHIWFFGNCKKRTRAVSNNVNEILQYTTNYENICHLLKFSFNVEKIQEKKVRLKAPNGIDQISGLIWLQHIYIIQTYIFT